MATLPVNDYNYNNYKDADYYREFGVVHYGNDFKSPQGTPVKAPISGNLYRVPANSPWASNRNGAGFYSLALYADDGTLHLFAHLSSNIINYYDGTGGIENGSRVEEGQVIGKVGSLGFSSGPHLHWQVLNTQINKAFDQGYFPNYSGWIDYTINPMDWYNSKNKGENVRLIREKNFKVLITEDNVRVYHDSECTIEAMKLMAGWDYNITQIDNGNYLVVGSDRLPYFMKREAVDKYTKLK